MRSFRIKTEPKRSFTRVTRNGVTRIQNLGFPKVKMHMLAFHDLEGSKVNPRFKFGVVSS